MPTGKVNPNVAVVRKKSEADHLRELERSQADEIVRAERVVGAPGRGPAPISLRLSKPLLERLDRIAADQHRTRSNLIQYVLWAYVHQMNEDQSAS